MIIKSWKSLDLKTHLVVTRGLSTQSFVNSLDTVQRGGTKHAFLEKETTLPYLPMNLGA